MTAQSSTVQRRRASMTLVEEEKEKPLKGFGIDMFKNKTFALQSYQCVLCQGICRNPVELACDDEADCSMSEFSAYSESGDDKLYNHDVLYCEACLSYNLSLNDNQCPLNPKHLKTNYNLARNIRKQINNLTVYCSNKQIAVNPIEGDDNGCVWEGKLSKLELHLKSCKYNKTVRCDICNVLCAGNTLKQHNHNNISKHIGIIYQKMCENNENKISDNYVLIFNQFKAELEQQISDLTNKNQTLKQSLYTFKAKYNEWKIAYSIETKKKEIDLQKQIDSCQKRNKQLQLKSDSQGISIETLNKKHTKLQKEFEQLRKLIRSNNKTPKKTDRNGKKMKAKKKVKLLRLLTDQSVSHTDSDSDESPKLVRSRPKLSNHSKSANIKKSKKSKANKKGKSLKKDQSLQKLTEYEERESDPISDCESPLPLLGHRPKLTRHYTSLVIGKDSKKLKDRSVKKVKNVSETESDNSDSPVDIIGERPKFIKNAHAKSLSLPSPKSAPAKNGFKPPPLRRTPSMKYFHPSGTERYHPKGLKYEWFHPKKAEEVWVKKNMGSVAKLYRYPCCGSAKEGPLHLALVSSHKSSEPMYVVNKGKLPKNWNDEIYLGCTRNRKKNKKNMSFYECCEKGIMSVGCKKRYKCCQQDCGVEDKSEGCKVGWGC